MHSVERRIAELEKAGTAGGDPLAIVIRGKRAESLRWRFRNLYRSKGSQQWKRQMGEAEQEFIDRSAAK